MVSDAFIAVDWGTTNRRIVRIEDGAVVAAECDDRGAAVLRRDDYPAEIAAIRARLGDVPMLLAGMVGSTIGWHAVPYVSAPVDLAALAGALVTVAPRVAIVPGVAIRDPARPDVMRGEEVQVLGAAAAGLLPDSALVCQPGTHCKWVTVRGARIADFTSAMTGELFALLRGHGLLAPQLTGAMAIGAAFRDGVRRGACSDLAAALFGVRAGGVLGLRDDADAASYASGVLIGSDVAARLADAPQSTVHVLAEGELGALYAAAIALLGGSAVRVDSQASFVAGIVSLREHAA